MKKNEKILLGVVIGAAVVGGLFYLDSRKNKSEKLGETTRGEEAEEDVPSESIFPLEVGDVGEEVKILQQYLNRSKSCKDRMPQSSPTSRVRPLLPLEEDGIFGEKTKTVTQVCYSSGSINEVTYQTMKAALEKMTIDNKE